MNSNDYRGDSQKAMAKMKMKKMKQAIKPLVEEYRVDATLTVAAQLISMTKSEEDRMNIDWLNTENPVRTLKSDQMPSELVEKVVLDFIAMMSKYNLPDELIANLYSNAGRFHDS